MTVATSTTRTMACALAGALVLAVVCAGCGGSHQAKRAVHAELMSDADLDSVGLERFFTLPGEERVVRRLRAETWRNHAADTDDSWARAEALQTAVGLAPDDPHAWLDLAETTGWLGNDLAVDAALLAATAALRNLNEPVSDLRVTREERNEIVVRTSLLRAWYHYDRAEWHKGLSWARAGLQVETGSDRLMVIKGLLEAGAQQRVQAEIAAEDVRRRQRTMGFSGWIRAIAKLAYGDPTEAYHLGWGCGATDEHTTECFLDVGFVAETVGEWDAARRWYAESAAALHPGAARYRTRVDNLRLGEGVEAVEMPVWLSFDRHFLTGSLSAYTALVFERFSAADDSELRMLWGGETVNAAGILLRRNQAQDRPWALRARGLVFLDQDKLDRSREDLERAERLFSEAGREDRLVAAALGRLWLRQENHKKALPYLERAVLLSPTEPDVWSDLGLVKVMARDGEGAAAAFGRAIELDPDATAAWYNRGLMRLHAGDLDAAASDLGEAARLAPDNAEVAHLLQRIRVMQREETGND
ncbi:MAG: tetratricopeptide repeat protein [bacterium]|nr:tetratricopeptide repeat protein [bacterium]